LILLKLGLGIKLGTTEIGVGGDVDVDVDGGVSVDTTDFEVGIIVAEFDELAVEEDG